MKNKTSLIALVAIISFAFGLILGSQINWEKQNGSTSEQDVLEIPDSTITRVLEMPQFCNEELVEANVRKHFSFYFPNTQIIDSSMAIQDMGDCVYHIRLRVKSGYVRKTLILQYTYDYSFSKYFVKTLKESNY